MSSTLQIGSSNIIGTLEILATASLASQSSAWQGCSNNSIKLGFRPVTNLQASSFVYARLASILSLALPFKLFCIVSIFYRSRLTLFQTLIFIVVKHISISSSALNAVNNFSLIGSLLFKAS